LKTLLVIPARLHSTRLPEKMLLNRTGKPLLQHTWEAITTSQLADKIIVATDSERIAEAVSLFGGNVVLTDSRHASGTDRLGEVAQRFPDYQILVNVQGDEPEIAAADVDSAIRLVLQNESCDMATLATHLPEGEQLVNPATVKVVFDRRQRALYFSRAPIPWPRDGFESVAAHQPDTWFQHIGIYVYRRETLLELIDCPRPPCEVAESLEQLRALHLGKSILVGIVPHATRGIDTPEDYEAFVRRNST
jgi:3-deoxy-manno-octulosonate cytidylyltransferase (CMP-KDO synthetase)